MNNGFNLHQSLSDAVRQFWDTKSTQLISAESSNSRGSVVGGKQLDGFLTLLKDACISVGIPSSCIYDRHNYVPGFFRSTKDWDLIIISPSGKLIAAVELKSQIGSYGNNFNNRAEEALGSATDLWTAYRERQFLTYGTPWVGYLMLIGYDDKSTVPVRNYENHFAVRPEFINASYIDRYRILLEKLTSERLYTATCLLYTKDRDDFGNVGTEISIERFINSLQGFLIGCLDEFNN